MDRALNNTVHSNINDNLHLTLRRRDKIISRHLEESGRAWVCQPKIDGDDSNNNLGSSGKDAYRKNTRHRSHRELLSLEPRSNPELKGSLSGLSTTERQALCFLTHDSTGSTGRRLPQYY